MRPYRDPNFHANGKLPFMTPIIERTESSLGAATMFQNRRFCMEEPADEDEDNSNSKTDSPWKLKMMQMLVKSPVKSGDEQKNDLSSPFKAIVKLTKEFQY